MVWTGSFEQWLGTIMAVAGILYYGWDWLAQTMLTKEKVREVAEGENANVGVIEVNSVPERIHLAYERIRTDDGGSEESYINAWYELANTSQFFGEIMGEDEFRVVGKGIITDPLVGITTNQFCAVHRTLAPGGDCSYPYVRAHKFGKFGLRGLVVRKFRQECDIREVVLVHPETMKDILAIEGNDGETVHTYGESGR